MGTGGRVMSMDLNANAGVGTGAGVGGRPGPGAGPGLRLNRLDDRLIVSYGDVELFHYVHEPRMDPFEGPKPYLHPVRTLAGDVVTCYRPHDHRWHKGLQMTASDVSGQNFWGGGSYVRGRGYVDLPNVGTIRHEEFTEVSADGERIRLGERLSWHTQADDHWVDETRTLTVHGVAEGSWSLDFDTALRNVRGAALEFGSPTTNGRELAGYTGFFWRGPRSFTGGDILAAGGLEGPALMGATAAWLAFVGRHDEVDRASTLLFVDGSPALDAAGGGPGGQGTPVPGAAGHGPPDQGPVDVCPPTRWFVRDEPFAAVNPSFAFFDPVTLEPGGTLRLACRVVVADGAWDRDRIERHLEAHPW